MAKFYIKNASVVVNSVDLSDHCKSVEITMTANELDTTAMGATGETQIQGLRKDQFKIKWYQDQASGKVDATLSPLFTGGTEHSVVVKADSGGVTATNPKWTGTLCTLFDYTPLSGEDVGSIAMTETTHKVSGAIARAEA